MSLTPTHGFTTGDMIRRKTREKRGPHEICRACRSTRQNGQKWKEMPCVGMQHSVWKRCRRFAVVPHVRRCFA